MLDQDDLLFEVCAAGALACEPGGDVGVARADNPLLNEVEYVLDGALDAPMLGPQGFEVRPTLADGG